MKLQSIIKKITVIPIVLTFLEVVSPIVLKEKKLKEEEDRILELEAMAKQYILAAEKV